MAGTGDVVLVALALVALGGAAASVAALVVDRSPLARQLAQRVVVAQAVLAGVAVLMLGWALATSDFTVAYVAQQSRRGGSLGYRVAGLWGGMAGSLLLWIAMLAGFGLAIGPWRRRAREHEPERGRVDTLASIVLSAMVGAFAAVLVLLAHPFRRLDLPPLDGQGLTPILEHPAMLYHPPILYLGLTSLAVPFAFTVAEAMVGHLSRAWLARSRRWMLASWSLLALGMLAGAHWAYVELGWGGFWAWDPVENTALMPWLAVTAFLHLAVRRRETLAGSDGGVDGASVAGGRSGWTAPALVVLAFVLALTGTTLTRSGAAPSVHAFAEDAGIGWALAVIALVGAAVSTAGLVRAQVRERPRAGSAPATPKASLRSWALAANVVIVLMVLAVVTTGTVYPAVVSDGAAVGGEYFARFCGPLALGLLVLMIAIPRRELISRRSHERADGRLARLVIVGAALATGGVFASLLVGWRSAFTVAALAAATVATAGIVVAFARDRRAAHVAHLGFVLLMLGIAGSTTAQSTAGTLAVGERTSIGRYEIRNVGVELIELAGVGNYRVESDVTVWRGGEQVARLEPSLLVRRTRGLLLAETSLRSTPLDDVQVALRDAGDDGEALLEITVRPLVWWVWWGSLLLVIGGGASTIGGTLNRRRSRRPVADRRPASSAGADRALAEAVRRPMPSAASD